MAPLRRTLIGLLLCLPALTHGAEALTVKRVIDGDTIVLSNDEHVRLIGVNTSETRNGRTLNNEIRRTKKDAATIKALGKKSKAFTKLLVEGRPVKLKYDISNKKSSHRDRFQRTLAYVYIDESQKQDLLERVPPGVAQLDSFEDGFLNALLIEAGYGNAFTTYPFHYKEDFLQYERDAREHNRGLWAN